MPTCGDLSLAFTRYFVLLAGCESREQPSLPLPEREVGGQLLFGRHVRTDMETRLDLPAKSHMTHQTATVAARIKRPNWR